MRSLKHSTDEGGLKLRPSSVIRLLAGMLMLRMASVCAEGRCWGEGMVGDRVFDGKVRGCEGGLHVREGEEVQSRLGVHWRSSFSEWMFGRDIKRRERASVVVQIRQVVVGANGVGSALDAELIDIREGGVNI